MNSIVVTHHTTNIHINKNFHDGKFLYKSEELYKNIIPQTINEDFENYYMAVNYLNLETKENKITVLGFWFNDEKMKFYSCDEVVIKKIRTLKSVSNYSKGKYYVNEKLDIFKNKRYISYQEQIDCITKKGCDLKENDKLELIKLLGNVPYKKFVGVVKDKYLEYKSPTDVKSYKQASYCDWLTEYEKVVKISNELLLLLHGLESTLNTFLIYYIGEVTLNEDMKKTILKQHERSTREKIKEMDKSQKDKVIDDYKQQPWILIEGCKFSFSTTIRFISVMEEAHQDKLNEVLKFDVKGSYGFKQMDTLVNLRNELSHAKDIVSFFKSNTEDRDGEKFNIDKYKSMNDTKIYKKIKKKPKPLPRKKKITIISKLLSEEQYTIFKEILDSRP